MNISKSSWHYRLLMKFSMAPGWWRDNNQTNLCEYMRALGMILTLIAIAAFMVITYPYGWYLLLHKPDHVTVFGVIVMMAFSLTNFALAITALAGITFGLVKLNEKYNKAKQSDEPGPFTTYFRSLKEKTCVLVNYK